MPEDRIELEDIKNAIVGRRGLDKKRGGDKELNMSRFYFGRKLLLRDETDLNDFIEMDFNPTTWPISASVEYNDQTVINGDDALEYKGRGAEEFTLALFFSDYGFYKEKKFSETTAWKLAWLFKKTKPIYREVDGQLIQAPPVIFVEKGFEAIRTVILKIDGIEEMQDVTFTPIRATVSVTFRKVFRVRERETSGEES